MDVEGSDAFVVVLDLRNSAEITKKKKKSRQQWRVGVPRRALHARLPRLAAGFDLVKIVILIRPSLVLPPTPRLFQERRISPSLERKPQHTETALEAPL